MILLFWESGGFWWQGLMNIVNFVRILNFQLLTNANKSEQSNCFIFDSLPLLHINYRFFKYIVPSNANQKLLVLKVFWRQMPNSCWCLSMSFTSLTYPFQASWTQVLVFMAIRESLITMSRSCLSNCDFQISNFEVQSLVYSSRRN